jgi:hypothetical protein
MFAQELTQQSNLQKTRLASASGSWLRILTWQVFFGYVSIHAHFMSIFLFKKTIVAMVGERLVSACGWDGGATMRSVAATVRERLRFFCWIAS